MLGTGSLVLAFGLVLLVPGGIARPFFWMTCSLLLTAAVMLWGSKVGKLNLR